LSSDFKSATALSVDAGESSAVRDLHWLGQNIRRQAACPAGTDIPGYLEAIYQGRFAAAYEINLRDNVFPSVLGRVCSRPCEDACRHGWEGNGDPVAICFSKRSAADFGSSAPVVLKR
jgi:formate dehydrogenase major subunit